MLIYAIMRMRKNEIASFEQKLIDSRKVQLVMDELRDKTNIERVIVMRCNNGKGIHRYGFQLYVDGVYQSYEPPFSSVIEHYDQLQLDGAMIKIVQQVYNNGWIAFNTDDMPDCILRSIYESSGVRWAAVYNIGEKKSEGMFYFMSIATSQEKSPFELNQGAHVNLAVNNMRNLFRKLNRGVWRRLLTGQ